MKNKYGYFKYLDYAVGAKPEASYSINAELQTFSSLEHLTRGVNPYNFASFQQDAYDTEAVEPQRIMVDAGIVPTRYQLGILTNEISDEQGDFATPIELVATWDTYQSMLGITITSRNIISQIEIVGFRDNEEVGRGVFSATEYEQFYDLPLDLVNKVVFTITKVEEPYHFLWITNIDYGKTVYFKDDAYSEASITKHFSVLGDKLEYDTLDLNVVNTEKREFLFQRKQPIEYINGENEDGLERVIETFYLEQGDENDGVSLSLTGYDAISNLEDTFYGGIYQDYPLEMLILDIIGDLYFSSDVSEIRGRTVTGYLPISTRRKALIAVLQGTNTRLYKGENYIFKSLDLEPKETVYDEHNVLENPVKTKKNDIKCLLVENHIYSKSNEEQELYNWYIEKDASVTITFSSPAHSLKAYEVTGTDKDGNDVVSSTQSSKVVFLEVGVNYCVVNNSSDNKIVIKGKKYVKNTVNYRTDNNLLTAMNFYDEVTVPITITDNARAVSQFLYSLYSRKVSVKFKTLVEPEIGACYNILGENLNITSVRHDLDGVYEVEAV